MSLEQQSLVKCPLNPLHLVKKSKMDYHLIRCKQQVDPKKIETCPFNASHIWLKDSPEMNLDKHMKECPSRPYVLQGFNPKSVQTTQQPQKSDWGDDEEDWGAGPAPAQPREIQIGKSQYAYKPPAERRRIRDEMLSNFKANLQKKQPDQN